MSKLKVAVIMGGPSREHDISLATGKSVLENIDDDKYDVFSVEISKQDHWKFPHGEALKTIPAIHRLKTMEVDVVFNALHGTFGEDGVVQALLDREGIKYTGSTTPASLMAMDKETSGELYELSGMNFPPAVLVRSEDIDSFDSASIQHLGDSLVVKPVRQGSSVGISMVSDPNDLVSALHEAARYDLTLMIQKRVKGREVSCGVLERNGELIALPPTELIPKDAEFFDYDAKYEEGATDEITPPDMPKETIQAIQNAAENAHRIIGCRSYSRTDMIVEDDGEIQMIETNTLPGMTKTSILPQQAAAADIEFSELLDIIIDNALKV